MAKYTGCQCIVCHNLFQENDDIVVCPDCGTPYHRSCYTAEGACINEKLHAAGTSWQQQRDALREKIGGKECPVCHHTNAPGAKQCEVCYTSLGAEENADGRPGINLRMPDGTTVFYDGTDPTCGLPKEELFEEETLEDVANYVRDNSLGYLLHFKKFKETGKKLTVNFPALLFPQLFFAYRKMWPAALLTMVAGAVLGIPGLLINLYSILTDSEQQALFAQLYAMDFAEMFGAALPFLEANLHRIDLFYDVSFFLDIVMRLGLCLFANWLYYRHVLRRVKKIREGSASLHDKTCILKAEGGVSFWNFIGAFALDFLITMVVSAAVLMPFLS